MKILGVSDRYKNTTVSMHFYNFIAKQLDFRHID